MAVPPLREAIKGLSQALSADDLGGARKAYAAVVRNAPEGAQWKPDSAFAEMGRALVQGDLPAAKEAAKAGLSELRERLAARPPQIGPTPRPPAAATALPASANGRVGGQIDELA